MPKARMPQVLVAAASPRRVEELISALAPLAGRGIVGGVPPRLAVDLSAIRLLVYEGEALPELLAPLLEGLPARRHIVLAFPALSLAHVAFFLGDTRVSHLFSAPVSLDDLAAVADKLDTGAIFGLERYLPGHADVCYRKLESYEERCEVLEEIDAAVKKARLRSAIRRVGAQVAEELLMNAMYQAPRDGSGNQVFAEIEPAARIRRPAPRPVSLRYSIAGGALHLSVRDRYGSFHRQDLTRALRRCLSAPIQIEEKKLGAGLGLYLCASSVSRFVVNIMPGVVTEFVCIIEPRAKGEALLREVSVTAHRSLP